ncbi:thioredoxin-like protein [Aspergillus japonicus CBS 114.51]|uniref:Thioredoxin-like protein n=2 Tax=Aspergillus TaxID=5052 RepID=A0A2V5HNK1_ASPV1|nr:thioredoxin-like protein [Aspergillus japonicus CBS 114.51]PYI23133.1 thioredoxin-like protein [Aspergillus violaceofuscus CBS 115571]RAH81013.1 thioredoxin-like protein [Aspergillus japonicus CBS 114.51]
MPPPLPTEITYTLYTYYQSTCANRVVIALHHKSLPFTHHYIDLRAAEHETAAFAALNPSHSLPVLVITDATTGTETILTQSVAILEYLEEAHPDRAPLLPPAHAPLQRARVRELVNLITNDIQPLSNGRIARRVRQIRDEVQDQLTFVQEVNVAGLTAYERLLERYGADSMYSVGDEVTLADVCLVPAVEMAVAYRTDLSGLGRVRGVVERLKALQAFRMGDWRRQGDTPVEVRID